MSRCQKCGEYNSDQDLYCYACGTQLVYVTRQDGFDILLRDFRFQSFWSLRLVAYLLDVFIISVLGFLLSVFAYVPLLFGSFLGSNWAWTGVWMAPFYLGLAQIVYSVRAEQVSDVWVAGRQQLDSGLLTGIDLQNLFGRTNEWQARIAATRT